MSDSYAGFKRHLLGDTHHFFTGRIPDTLIPSQDYFNTLWNLHPSDPPMIHLHGRKVAIPRWQQAYGADYHFSGQTSRALSVPLDLEPFHAWAQSHVHALLNGLLLNWYEADLGHYIGQHRDSTRNMVTGAPIVTISLGQERIFRLTRQVENQKLVRDFSAVAGTVFVMPYETNLAWKHGIPRLARHHGRRISITLRAFLESASGSP